MSTITTGLQSAKVCESQIGKGDFMTCSGIASGMGITQTGSSVTIQPGVAYVPVTDSLGIEYNVKVILDTATTLTVGGSQDIIITVPQSNVVNPAANGTFTDIATITAVANGTGGDFHLVLASTNAGSTIQESQYAGHYLPGCDFCLKCEGGVLQLPSINVDGDTTVSGSLSSNSLDTGNIQSGNIVSSGTITANAVVGDGSGLTNLTFSAAYMDQTTPGLAQIATNTEANVGTNSTKVIVPSQLKIHTDKYIDSGTINGVGTITITHNLGRTLNIVRFYGENNVASTTGFYDPIQGHKTISNTNGTLAIDNSSLYDVVSGGFSGKVQVSAVTDTTIDLTFTGNFNSDVLYLIEVS